MPAIDDIMSLLQTKGTTVQCAGGPASQLDHALQTAHLAQSENAPPNLVVAALLHDVGHLLGDGHNPEHANVGHSWVAQNFPPEVSEPVRLHVDAKRYLCATDNKYLEKLSPTSVESLHKQGGPMTDVELDAFEEEAHYPDAVKLRHWDDQAKTQNLAVPALGTYRETIAKLLKPKT